MDKKQLKHEFEQELIGNILPFWIEKVYDPDNKTFYGRIDLNGKPDQQANKSAVLITRILWTFSAAYRMYPNPEYKQMAGEAFRILATFFLDKEYGGIFWEIQSNHSPANTKKQFYALAFCIYACSECYLAFGNEQAREMALSLYRILEMKSFDPSNNGYIDVLSRDYRMISGLRLSEKEMADTWTMNTHLHILEAYTNLFRIWKNNELKLQLTNLLNLFLEKILNPQTWHFQLFFDKNWKNVGDVDSYGHDIEGTWLMVEAAEALNNTTILEKVNRVAIKMADTTIQEGWRETTGGLLYEKENGKLHEEFHWWPQAESVIGFFNAWQISKDKKYLNIALKNWEFIKEYISDKKHGEWFWGVDQSLNPLAVEKVNGWKGPYHNSRMCMEMVRRLMTPTHTSL
jgi:cellobiose epimerase